MIAVILAGGKGTRLREVTKDLPKPLVKINGKPVLRFQIESLQRSNIKKIILVIGYQGHKIKEYFGDGASFGVEIEYFEEVNPLGTAGSFYFLKDQLPDHFLVIYGDLVLDINFNRFIEFHRNHHSQCTLFVHPNNHPYDSDVLILDNKGVVKDLLRKNRKRSSYYNNCVNAGVTLLRKEALSNIKKNIKQDLEENVIIPLISSGRVFGYKSTEYVRDMGTPERYRLVQEHLTNGIVAKRNSIYKQKAIFLDRDGTINKHVGLVSKPEDLEILQEAFSAIEMINRSEYLAIVITNQSVVARNLCSIEQLEEIHRKMEVELGKRDIYIDDLYYCPHHPDKGFPEENVLYKVKCDCRKPEIGLIRNAVRRHNIDSSKSYFIGDTFVDVQTGKNASLKTILLGVEEQMLGAPKPDYYCDNLLDAVKIILKQGVVNAFQGNGHTKF